MICIWNRKEVYHTCSMREQAKIRCLLEDSNINYTVTTINRNSPSPFFSPRAYTGTLGQNLESAYEYIIYVAKRHEGLAREIIEGQFRR